MERKATDTAITLLGSVTEREFEKISPSFHGDIIIEGKLTITKDVTIHCGLYISGALDAGNFSINIHGDFFSMGQVKAYEINVKKDFYNIGKGKINCCYINTQGNFYNEGKINSASIIVAEKFYNEGDIKSSMIDVYDNLKVVKGKITADMIIYRPSIKITEGVAINNAIIKRGW